MTFSLKDYTARPDLISEHQTAVYYMSDYGSIIRVRGRGWYCTNDCRYKLVGTMPNDQLAQPTLGPFKTAREACKQRELRRVKR